MVRRRCSIRDTLCETVTTDLGPNWTGDDPAHEKTLRVTAGAANM